MVVGLVTVVERDRAELNEPVERYARGRRDLERRLCSHLRQPARR